MPPIRNFKHCQSSSCENEGEQKLLKLMFYHIKNAEYEQIHMDNAYEMRKQFQALKAKLARKSEHEYTYPHLELYNKLWKISLGYQNYNCLKSSK
jgi:hypothetical protein